MPSGLTKPKRTIVFSVLPAGAHVPTEVKNRAFLLTDWDDWFKYSTQYALTFVNHRGEKQDIGQVKIGQFEMEEDQRRPALPKKFESLDSRFFSLGQDESYYEALNKEGDEIRDEILRALRDVVFDSELWQKAKHESVTEVSLLRSVTDTAVKGQFRRLAQGGARLTSYHFSGATCKPTEGEPRLSSPAELSMPQRRTPIHLCLTQRCRLVSFACSI